MSELVDRAAAVEATQAQFAGVTFAWGTADCLGLARAHAVNRGHKNLPAIPAYRSLNGARAALKATGFKSLIDLLDGYFERIPPARMLPGDIAAMRGTKGFPALAISAGAKLIGFHEDVPGLVNIVIRETPKAAWRV